MEWDLQFVAIIVTVLLAVGGGFWRIIATMNKGFAEARREAREGRKEAREAVDKLRTEMNAGFAAAQEALEKGLAEAKDEREKGFAAAEKAREKGFAEAKEAREKGFAAAKEERREIKDEMNRRFDAVETRIARLEAPYFQKRPQGHGGPVERVAEPRPSEKYAVVSGRTGESLAASGREADSPDESGQSPAKLVGDSALGQDD